MCTAHEEHDVESEFLQKALFQWDNSSENPSFFTLSDLIHWWASLVAQTVKSLPEMWGTRVQSLGQKDPLEKGIATHFRILAWGATVHGVEKDASSGNDRGGQGLKDVKASESGGVSSKSAV